MGLERRKASCGLGFHSGTCSSHFHNFVWLFCDQSEILCEQEASSFCEDFRPFEISRVGAHSCSAHAFRLCLRCFCFSAVSFLSWRMAPKRNKNNALCFLTITVGIFLWVAVLLPLASTSIGANNMDELPRFSLFVVLVGATPSAACPAILLYGGSAKTTRKP